MEMTKEDFQKWIRMNLKHELLMEVEDKCKLLQSLLERREKLAVLLLQLCRSVIILYPLYAVVTGVVNAIWSTHPPFGSLEMQCGQMFFPTQISI